MKLNSLSMSSIVIFLQTRISEWFASIARGVRHSNSLNRIFLAVIAAVVCFVLAVFAIKTTPRPVIGSQPPSQSAAPKKEQLFGAELVTIRPQGFEPTELIRPQGNFLLAVDNRTGLDELVLRLERDIQGRHEAVSVNKSLRPKDGQVMEVRMQRDVSGWRSILDLQPGRYVLTADNHPDWTCQIIINSR